MVPVIARTTVADDLPGDGGIGLAESCCDLVQGQVVFELLLDE